MKALVGEWKILERSCLFLVIWLSEFQNINEQRKQNVQWGDIWEIKGKSNGSGHEEGHEKVMNFWITDIVDPLVILQRCVTVLRYMFVPTLRTQDTGRIFKLIFMKFTWLVRVHLRVNHIVFGNNQPNGTTDCGKMCPQNRFFGLWHFLKKNWFSDPIVDFRSYMIDLFIYLWSIFRFFFFNNEKIII